MSQQTQLSIPRILEHKDNNIGECVEETWVEMCDCKFSTSFGIRVCPRYLPFGSVMEFLHLSLKGSNAANLGRLHLFSFEPGAKRLTLATFEPLAVRIENRSIGSRGLRI